MPRIAFPAVTAFFASGLWWNAVRLYDGRIPLTTTLKVTLPLIGLFVVAGVLSTLLLWTSRVWVDADAHALHQKWLWQHNVVDLTRPEVVRFWWQFSAEGSFGSGGQWKGYFQRPDGPEVFVATPWVPNFVDLAVELQPALDRNPLLPADDYTRRILESPHLAAKPQELTRPAT